MKSNHTHGIFNRLLLWIIGAVPIPRSYRRAIFLSTICGFLKRNMEDSAIIRKLNEVLSLRETNVVSASIHATNFVWHDVFTVHPILHFNGREVQVIDAPMTQFNETELSALSEYFARYAPDWVRYGSFELLKRDAAFAISRVCKVC